jgi:hypothetical protein
VKVRITMDVISGNVLLVIDGCPNNHGTARDSPRAEKIPVRLSDSKAACFTGGDIRLVQEPGWFSNKSCKMLCILLFSAEFVQKLKFLNNSNTEWGDGSFCQGRVGSPGEIRLFFMRDTMIMG